MLISAILQFGYRQVIATLDAQEAACELREFAGRSIYFEWSRDMVRRSLSKGLIITSGATEPDPQVLLIETTGVPPPPVMLYFSDENSLATIYLSEGHCSKSMVSSVNR